MIDCLLKDDKIHTDYKNSYKLVKDSMFDEKIFKINKNITCIPDKNCEICPKLAKGIPNSIKIETNNIEIFKKVDKKTNVDNLPTCPYSDCNSCEDNKYKLYDNAFNNNLIEKYSHKKK